MHTMRRRRGGAAITVLAMAAGLAAAETASAQDAVIEKNYGLTQFRPAAGTYSNMVVDASDAQFTIANSKNEHPTWSADCTVGSLPVNHYPLNLDKQPGITFLGGTVNSQVPQTSEWRPTYCNSSAVIVLSSNDATVDGVRVVGSWDGVRFSRDSNHFRLANAWLTDVRDDCLENDQLRSGRIEDVLFDGCFVGISTDPGGSSTVPSEEHNHTVVMDRVLMRMQSYPFRKSSSDPLQNTHGHIFKGESRAPSFEITNSVFAYEADPFMSDARLTLILDRTKRCENNEVLWLSDEPLPAFFDHFPSSCFTIRQGQAAHDAWQEARRDWIDCHPDNIRTADDDASVPAQCSRSGGAPQTALPNPPTELTVSD
ncbi:MAG: hypothetical protein JXB36_14030 [Gammaproteobacteria bacterium]|nr:hypothetical protein [Gammaproteobacteria bacterium]